MNKCAIKLAFLLILLFFTGCAHYEIPIETDSHPASSDNAISQIELSPILNIKVEENHGHSER